MTVPDVLVLLVVLALLLCVLPAVGRDIVKMWREWTGR